MAKCYDCNGELKIKNGLTKIPIEEFIVKIESPLYCKKCKTYHLSTNDLLNYFIQRSIKNQLN